MPHTHSRPLHIRDDHGQTMAEYAFLISLIAAVVALSLPLLGTSISGLFNPLVTGFGG
jgi:Flp pilus assembly pilin Flp